MFKRIISCFLTLSIVFIPLVVPVFADIGQDDPGDLIPEYDTPVSGSGAGPIAPLPVGTGVSMKASLRDLLANLRPILDKAGVFLGFDVLTDLAKEYMCPNLLGMITMHPFHEWYTPADFPEHKVCLKCGKTTTEIDVTWKDLWDDFVNRLPPGLSASDQGVTIYGTGLQIDYTYELGNQYWRNFDLYGTLNAADFGVLLTWQ